MATITTIGLKIANQLFKCTGFKMVAKWLSAGSWSVVMFWHSFQKLPPCLVGLRLVPRLTIDRGNSKRLAIRYI